MNSRIRAPFYVFFFNPDYVAAPSLRSLHSNYFITFIASFRYFIKSIASSRCVEDFPRDSLVHTLADDKYSPTH